MNKQISIKKFAIISLCLIIASSSLGYVIAQTFSSPDLWLDDYPALPDFVVKTDGYYSWGVNSSGAILAQSANIITTLNEIVAAANEFDTIFLKGNYIFPSTWTINKSIIVDGNCHITINSGFDDNIIEITANNVTVINLCIDGNKSGQSSGDAIRFINATRLTICHNYISNAKEWAIHGLNCSGEDMGIKICENEIISSNAGIYFQYYTTIAYGLDIKDNSIEFPDTYGIYTECSTAKISGNTVYHTEGSASNYASITCALNGVVVSNNRVTGGRFCLEVGGDEGSITGNSFIAANWHGIYAHNVEHATITGNSIIDAGRETNNTYAGILLYQCDYMQIGENIITSFDVPINKMKYCVRDDSGTYNSIHDNTFYGFLTQGALADSETTKIYGNIGYTTELDVDFVFVPMSAKIADINETDTDYHTLDLQTALSETRTIVSIVASASRIGGSGNIGFYANSGTTAVYWSAYLQPACVVSIADNELKYSLQTANDDFDVYCFGYTVIATSDEYS